MGSGCNNISGKRPCIDPISSDCVNYVGEAVPLLGICTGDTITEVEAVIIEKLLSVLDGTGIVLSSVTLENCVYLRDLFAEKDSTVANFIQLLVDSQCTLKTLIDQITAQLNDAGFSFDLKCLPAVANPNRDKILQQLITSFCEVKGIVDNIVANAGDTTVIDNRINTALNGLITSSGGKGITKTVTNGVPHYNFTALVMPFSIFLYRGPMNVFDNTGLGIPGTYAEGFAIMNGQNNTDDWRGFVGVGAIKSVPGPSLDPLVDPNINSDASLNYSVGDKGGKHKVSLTANQNGSHSHTITQTPHSHGYDKPTLQSNSDKGGIPDYVSKSYGQTDGALANITINTSGQGEAHENRMPFKAAVWVQRLNV